MKIVTVQYSGAERLQLVGSSSRMELMVEELRYSVVVIR
jgi:hypothetical protein